MTTSFIEKLVLVDFTHELQKVWKALPQDDESQNVSHQRIPLDKIVEFCFPEPDDEVLSQTEFFKYDSDFVSFGIY
jgi:hypothetical protein